MPQVVQAEIGELRFSQQPVKDSDDVILVQALAEATRKSHSGSGRPCLNASTLMQATWLPSLRSRSRLRSTTLASSVLVDFIRMPLSALSTRMLRFCQSLKRIGGLHHRYDWQEAA
jgi:hypothetical protein